MSEKRVLIVDDNPHYQQHLKKILIRKKIYAIDYSVSAKDAFATIYHTNIPYDMIITDISMESQLSGIKMLFQLQNYIKKFSIQVIVASTGFNYPAVMYISGFLMRALRVQGLIPKKHLNDKTNLIYDLKDNNVKKINDLL